MGPYMSKEKVDQIHRNHQDEMQQQHGRHMETVKNLQESLEQLKDQMRKHREELNRPVAERRSKIDFVNGLKLKIRPTKAVLLLGTKGQGKSTFLWLRGKGPKPSKTTSDGTVDILSSGEYVDTIGLRGWTMDELVKLLVLLIYDGIPKDLILFCNDRIELPIQTLAFLGITAPIIVILSNEFWKRYNKGKIVLVSNKLSGVQEVVPREDVDEVYDYDAYKIVKELNMGTPITHHDDIQDLITRRAASGVSPFKHVMSKLGDTFHADIEIDSGEYLKEVLFRYIYIYASKYKNKKLEFMNSATLQEFK